MDGLVTGWKLDRAERGALLRRFPPRWPDVVAGHVTLASRRAGRPAPPRRGTRPSTADLGSAEDRRRGFAATPPVATAGLIVGRTDDGEGLEALVVEIDGATDRPDGSTFHITWSLDRARDRKPVQSNDVLARLGWEALAEPVPLTLIPARF